MTSESTDLEGVRGADRSDAVGSDADLESGAADDSATRDREEPALAVEGLSKTFGSGDEAVTAVEDVSFSVAPGEVIGLLGPNGAGKTTTIKSILGLLLPDEGAVRIHGIDVYDRPRAAYDHVDAMLEGARNDYWRLTVRENLRYFAAIRGRNPDALADRHEELLERLDLADRADTPVRELSRGMKQKVSLASVLAGDVSVAFLDEPTLGLDVESSLTLRRELVRLADERGLTLVVSSHDMDVIEAVCDRVVIMNEGRVVVDDTVENLLAAFETQGYRLTVRGADESTLAALRERFDVTDVERLEDRTRFAVAADSETFYRLTDALEDHGLELVAVDTVQPDLEDAFVELTGGNGNAEPNRESDEPHEGATR
ncbi:ABC transporter related protein [Haloterrigena turkmenica DSM 5511]|uniref:ABC transporter related protein n=1 Tax=Haloterrigena turkmenica (strain ATCC 51198 / DSM 5511 / JCM 9101 / NCIMB 13204 / VKM B-1734 / 4k) TaxID=543526 RepID=D2RUI3_HALTV|nr:ABC transporter ATP-binding protein [Haloterrigena turkmenica]ADB61155.1 ABC transporter related protein [Haloterrigena turkmenica DSM 5511]